MNFEEFETLQKQLFEERLKIAAGKGKEYAKESDRLANFKEEGQELEIDPLKVCHIFFNKHMRAIISYINKGQTLSEEGIRGRFLDAILYLELMYGLVVEMSKNTPNYIQHRPDLIQASYSEYNSEDRVRELIPFDSERMIRVGPFIYWKKNATREKTITER